MKYDAIGKVSASALVSEGKWKDQASLGTDLPENDHDKTVPCDPLTPGTEEEKSLRCDTGLPGIEVEKRFRAAAKIMARSEAAAAFYLAEIDDRRLWRELGYSSVIAYAAAVSGIAAKKAYALLNIGRRLREFDVIRTAFDEGRIGWTKVRDILRLKGPFDERKVLETAMTSSSRDLERFVAKKNESENLLKRKAVSGCFRNQAEIFEDEETIILEPMGKTVVENPVSLNTRQPDIVPKNPESSRQYRIAPKESAAVSSSRYVNVTLKLTPEEFAIFNDGQRVWKRKNPVEWKREKMVVSLIRSYLENEARASFEGNVSERIGASAGRNGSVRPGASASRDVSEKVGASSGEDIREKVALSGDDAERTGSKCLPENKTCEPGPVTEMENRAAAPVIIDSPYNIYIHRCPECEKSFMTGKSGDHIEVDGSQFEKALCDGALHIVDDRGVPGRKKRSVSPALRKKIFMRDGGACRVSGCDKTTSLEVHHVKPLSAGGDNDPSNLILCCSLCRYRHKLHYADFRIMPTWNTSSILISCMA